MAPSRGGKRRTLGRGGSRERGAAMVELAIVFPILMMLLLGIVTFGITGYQNISLEGASREASRFGATYPVPETGGIDAWLQDVATVAEHAAGGTLDATVSSRRLCIAQGTGSSPATFTRIRVVGSQTVAGTASEAGWCFVNNAPEEDTVVQVVLERLGSIETFVFSMSPKLHAEATTKFERRG